MKLVIPGKPMAKQRPRVLKNGITYTPKQTVNYETLVKQLYIEKYFQKQLSGPIKATITAYMYIPKSTSKKKKALMMENKILPTKKPDWDNIGKIITDALNGLAYGDDKQIVDATVRKFYSDKPRVEVELEKIEGVEE
ncbi:MAG TPA: RusA family crossover junction endodeoxyribonuclease [Clostridiales bacterium]|nr:RusA family crossover junction endodeoxyribonuclease [Clostridiales bacterium]